MSQAVLPPAHQQATWSGPCHLTPEPGFPIFKDRAMMSTAALLHESSVREKIEKAITDMEMLGKVKRIREIQNPGDSSKLWVEGKGTFSS